MSTFRLVPYESFSIPTALGRDEAIRRLAASIEPWRLVRNPFSSDHAPFEGSLLGDRFKINRVIHYRNSFLPVVEGRVLEGEVRVTMRLHLVVMAFVIALLGAAAGIALHGYRAKGPGAALEGAGFFAFVYALCSGGFGFEAAKAERFLRGLFA